jgi:pimeloyl-ACP methyl ester carboxylesterase
VFFHPGIDGGIALDSVVESQQFRFHRRSTSFEIYGYVTPYTRRPLASRARRNGAGTSQESRRWHDVHRRPCLVDQVVTDLPKTACDIHTAFFVIDGQDDYVTPTSAAVDYFNCVKAPKKELVLIPNAGHFAWMTASEKFLEALISKVRPVVITRGA